jgi:surface antigen
MQKSTLGTGFIALALLLTTLAASAQNVLFLRDSPIAWMDDTDEAILRETIEAVLAAPDGTVTDWLNPETGSKGRVQVTDTDQDFGTTCRRLRMRNEASGRKGGGNYRLCLSKDGQWRFAPYTDPPKSAADAKADSAS